MPPQRVKEKWLFIVLAKAEAHIASVIRGKVEVAKDTTNILRKNV